MEYLQYPDADFSKFASVIVLNLVINGIPSILTVPAGTLVSKEYWVLNLVINGIPSIQRWWVIMTDNDIRQF